MLGMVLTQLFMYVTSRKRRVSRNFQIGAYLIDEAVTSRKRRVSRNVELKESPIDIYVTSRKRRVSRNPLQ